MMMSAPQNSSENVSKSTIWKTYQDKDPTKDLLQIVGTEKIQSMLLDRNVLKKLVWQQVANDMAALGYDLGPDGGKACHQKWRNLKRAYIMYITKPGHRDPPYIKELQKALETTRKLIMPPANRVKPEVGNVSVNSELFEPELCSESASHSPNKSSNISVHVADVLAVMVKNNEERQKQEEVFEAAYEQRFKRLETLLQQQSEQLERLNEVMLEVSKQCGKKRKFCESLQSE
ncbi:hypothetical protein R5R35_008234 [Gryllus longicercus]|uniref:Myb/SANT-like DNA-binding domain-containing protein n=1 Tax=Gryllus longicercus TaxID=2509291 RepID=A0AAN9Z5C1_9ORTH|nr:Uncharacterized protein GBIM_20172 [Gryllus bimaculatus]